MAVAIFAAQTGNLVLSAVMLGISNTGAGWIAHDYTHGRGKVRRGLLVTGWSALAARVTLVEYFGHECSVMAHPLVISLTMPRNPPPPLSLALFLARLLLSSRLPPVVFVHARFW